jgi:DNA modification methylase
VIPEYFDKNFMIYQCDGLLFLNALSSGSVQLIWTSPPHDVDDQNPDDTKSVAQMEYVELCAAIADAAVRILTPGGVLVYSLSDQSVDSVVTAIAKRAHFQPEGVIWDALGLEGTVVVFRKGSLITDGTSLSDTAWPDGRLELIASFIDAHTEPGDLVVDPFCGYGDVMEAAANSGRVAVMNDLDPEAVTATVNRYRSISHT